MGRQGEGLEKAVVGVDTTATPYGKDEKLFTRSSQEGEYTTWTHLFTRDFGAAANLRRPLISNIGTSMVEDWVGITVNFVTFANVITIYPTLSSVAITKYWSDAHKYWVDNAWVAGGGTITVLRDGQVIWQRLITLDEIDSAVLADQTISPSGRYIAVVALSIATANRRYLVVYEGS